MKKRTIVGTTITVISIGIVLGTGYFATCDGAGAGFSVHSASDLFPQSNGNQDMNHSLSPFISSPLRASTRIHLKASPEEVFDYISSAESLPSWMPGLESVTYDHSDSVVTGALGEGSRRTMIFGGQEETEAVVRFERPHVMAYQIMEGVPLKNHVATMTVDHDDEGSILTWNQYFDLKRTSVYGWMMPFMVRRFLDEAQANLTDKFGGEATSTCRSKRLIEADSA